MRSVMAVVAGALLMVGSARGQPDGSSEAWWAAIDPDGVQRIHIRCGTNFLDPKEIVVRAHVPVVLSVSTEPNLVGHHFTYQLPAVGDADVDVPVGPMQRQFRFAAGLHGRYVVACRDPGQPPGPPPNRGKQGILRVVP